MFDLPLSSTTATIYPARRPPLPVLCLQAAGPPAAPITVPPPAATKTAAIGVVPTPPNNRPRSKAEQPIGALLEDFDSDGEGSYGPGPEGGEEPEEQQQQPAVGGESEQVAGGGRVAVGPSPPRVQVCVCVFVVCMSACVFIGVSTHWVGCFWSSALSGVVSL